MAQAFIKALQRAYEFAQENPDKVYEDLATDSFPAEFQQQVYTATTFAEFNPAIDDTTLKKAESTVSFLKENNIITNDVNVDEFFNTAVYDEAVQK